MYFYLHYCIMFMYIVIFMWTKLIYVSFQFYIDCTVLVIQYPCIRNHAVRLMSPRSTSQPGVKF